jgi:hypothetical protein
MVLNLDILNILVHARGSRYFDLPTFRANKITQHDRTVIAKLG